MKAREQAERTLDYFLRQKEKGIELEIQYDSQYFYKVLSELIRERKLDKTISVSTSHNVVKLYRVCPSELDFEPYVPVATKTDMARKTLDDFINSGQEIVLIKDGSEYYYTFYRLTHTVKYYGIKARREMKDLVLINGR